MSDDLTKRLRDRDYHPDGTFKTLVDVFAECDEAADYIESLEAKVRVLEARYENIRGIANIATESVESVDNFLRHG